MQNISIINGEFILLGADPGSGSSGVSGRRRGSGRFSGRSLWFEFSTLNWGGVRASPCLRDQHPTARGPPANTHHTIHMGMPEPRTGRTRVLRQSPRAAQRKEARTMAQAPRSPQVPPGTATRPRWCMHTGTLQRGAGTRGSKENARDGYRVGKTHWVSKTSFSGFTRAQVPIWGFPSLKPQHWVKMQTGLTCTVVLLSGAGCSDLTSVYTATWSPPKVRLPAITAGSHKLCLSSDEDDEDLLF